MLIAVSGWINHRQRQVIEYLHEENQVLREQLGGRRVLLDDHQRRKTDRPEIRWYCPSFTRRPRTADEIEALVVRLAEENRDCRVRRSLEEG